MNVPTEHDTLEIVSPESLECELNLVRAGAAGSLSGIFGPQSVTWQVDREAAIFLGAGGALLLQLAHPWVAAAIEQHSDTFADPVGRFHRTFSVIFTMVFGTLDQSLSVGGGTISRRFLLLCECRPRVAVGARFPHGNSTCGTCACAAGAHGRTT